MEGKATLEDKATLLDTAEQLKTAGSDLIILGCTEFPVLLGDSSKREYFVNTTDVIAQKAVERAMM